MQAVRRWVLCAVVALAPMRGHTDGVATVGGSPRAIGRAGAATVGDDGGGALLINPAAIARRDSVRVELGATSIEDNVEWQSDSAAAPRSLGRAGSRTAPLGAVIGALGGWIIGVGAMTAAVVERSLPRPADDTSDPSGNYDDRYEYRYTGISGSYRRDTLTIGAARRIGDSLALGLALGASRVRIAEHRRIWAGVGIAHPIGSAADDVDLALSGSDPFTMNAVAGVLYAPVDSPIELGASLGWAQHVRVTGAAQAVGTAMGPNVVEPCTPRAALTVKQPVVVRAGGRYVGDRVVGEIDGDLWIPPRGSQATGWALDGIRVVDPSQLALDLRWLPSRIAQRTHFAVRGALDVALVPGFLWAIGGYAFSTRATPPSRMSPSFGDLGGHTLGLGFETTASGVTITVGWSRTWSTASQVASELRLDGPFYGGDSPVPQGVYDGSIDQAGVLVEAELGGR